LDAGPTSNLKMPGGLLRAEDMSDITCDAAKLDEDTWGILQNRLLIQPIAIGLGDPALLGKATSFQRNLS